MKLTSKQVEVSTRRINATVTREQIDDLFYYDRIYEYKYNSIDETILITKYFDLDSVEGDYIFYRSNKKILRKIKLLILKGDEVSEILKNIIKNSEIISASDMTERKLSNEMAKSIDKKIIEELMRLGKKVSED